MKKAAIHMLVPLHLVLEFGYSKLHTYKYNEDLFKKVSVIPDGKNHGLVFILDWSGSMGTVLKDTVKQLYSLLWFCKSAIFV